MADNRNAPRQGTRERVYVMMTFLRDDNGDMVEGTSNILAGTSSEKVGREVLETFKKHRNGEVTMVHPQNEERFLPGALATMLDDAPPATAPKPEPSEEQHEEKIGNILDMVSL